MIENSNVINERNAKSMYENLKEKFEKAAEELARLIARLPEQEQAKIYYMLKGFEIFGRTVSEAKH